MWRGLITVTLTFSTAIHKQFPAEGLEVTEWIQANAKPSVEDLDRYLDRVKERSRSESLAYFNYSLT